VTRVDARGNVAGALHQLPLSSAKRPLEASCPSMAKSPSGSALLASDMVANAPYPRLVGATKAVSIHTCSSNLSCRAVGGPFNGYCYNTPMCRIDTSSGRPELRRTITTSSLPRSMQQAT
jgi:hypothetical protein